MLDYHIAVPSPFSCASSSLLRGKSDEALQLCNDYFKVNKVLKTVSIPLPWMEDCINQVGSAKYVCKFSLVYRGNTVISVDSLL